MTTTVTINAHCGVDKEVLVTISENDTEEIVKMQDGEQCPFYVYGGKVISVQEVIKQGQVE